MRTAHGGRPGEESGRENKEWELGEGVTQQIHWERKLWRRNLKRSVWSRREKGGGGGERYL